MIRTMTIEDYEQVYALWMKMEGFKIRSMDDSREGIAVFLKRNPDTSVVAEEHGRIVGSILCGHDGRRGCMYHVCVDPNYRMQGIGKAMVAKALRELRKEKINKLSLIAFCTNDLGNAFWKELDFEERLDLNYYDYSIDENNLIFTVGSGPAEAGKEREEIC